jgi:Transposase DDE domain
MSIVGDRAGLAPAAEALAELAWFRARLRECFTARGDALFELADALACAPGRVEGPAHLSLEPEFRRGWGMAYQALARGRVDAGRLKDLLAAARPAGPAWFAVDASCYPKIAASCSEDRGYVHHPSRHVNDVPYVPAWTWQWVAQLGTAPTSWTAPLDAARVPAASTASQAAPAQVRELAARLGMLAAVPLFVFDAGYDGTGLAMDLHHGPAPVRCQILVRLRTSRVFYADPPPRPPGKTGRRAVHGPPFRLADPATWPPPGQDLRYGTPAYGQVRVRAWHQLHPKITPARRQPGHRPGTPQPIIRGTVLRVDAERLRGHPGPAFLWLWHSGPQPPDPGECARAYLRRYDIEHTLRFAKQTLGWTAPALRTPGQTSTWTWLILAAWTQLRLARPLADTRLPWDHATRPATPARVRRAFRGLRHALGTPAAPPKPTGKSPGRPKGSRSAPAPRHPATRKATEKEAARYRTRRRAPRATTQHHPPKLKRKKIFPSGNGDNNPR